MGEKDVFICGYLVHAFPRKECKEAMFLSYPNPYKSKTRVSESRRNWKIEEGVISQGMQVASRSWKNQGT